MNHKKVCVLAPEDEVNLLQWMQKSENAGFAVSQAQFLASVQKIVKDKELDKNLGERPDRLWYECFMRRHPQLQRKSQKFPPRNEVSEVNLQDWFANVSSYLTENNLQAVLQNGRRVFVCEELTFYLTNEEKSKIVSVRGEENNLDKERMTSLFLVNATGQMAPPLVITRSQRLSKLLKDSIPNSWEIGRSENGWATAENFMDYVLKVFYPWLIAENISLPIVLFLDTTTSLFTLQLSEICQRCMVNLVGLYPRNNYLQQPLDVAFYHALKDEWRDVLAAVGKNKTLKREDFCPILKEILQKIDVERLVVEGFATSGLFPFKAELKVREVVFEEVIDENLRQKRLIVLRGIEEMIGDKVLAFRRCLGQWDGKVEDTSLFELWRKLRKDCGEERRFVDVKREASVGICQGFGNEVNLDIIKSEMM